MEKGRLNYGHLAVATIVSVLISLYCHARLGSDWWEVSGFITGIIAVYLTAKEHLSSWPVGIINVLLYAYVFWVAKLYADMTLQFLFFALSIHGWLSWVRGGAQSQALNISRIKPAHLMLSIAALAVGTAIYVPIINHYKGASPFWDSFLTVASVIAQVLLNRKVLENWVLWILIDIAYIPLYYSRHLYPTTILYVVFLGLAIGGLLQWLHNYRTHVAVSIARDSSSHPQI